MRSLLTILLLAFPVAPCLFGADYVNISKEQLMDKIKGAWAAQTIGCAYGGPTEFKYRGTIIPDSIPLQWKEHQIKNDFEKFPGLYDDVYMDLTFLDVLYRLGLDAPIDSFALAFAHAPYPLWHANQAARYNILQGIMPPRSGHWKYNPHADDIDYQIEADYAGIICPGLPNLASKYSDKIGHIMNYGDGWYGGVFVGAMYSLAFVTGNIHSIITQALSVIPQKTTFYQCMSDVLHWSEIYPNDWKKTWQCCQDKYSQDIGCPDGALAPFNIDAKMNCAYILIGLLYGHGDMGKTMEIATRCGQDSDCNPASAAGILGCIMGYNHIPKKWMSNLKEIEDINFAYTSISLTKAYQYSYELAVKNILRSGGKIHDSKVSIPVQKLRQVRKEQGFSNLVPQRVIVPGDISKNPSLTFSGNGIVLRCKIKSPQQDYVAKVDIYLDGKKRTTALCPTDFHDRKLDLCWFYNLPNTSHTLSFHWLNPVPEASIILDRGIIYQPVKK